MFRLLSFKKGKCGWHDGVGAGMLLENLGSQCSDEFLRRHRRCCREAAIVICDSRFTSVIIRLIYILKSFDDS